MNYVGCFIPKKSCVLIVVFSRKNSKIKIKNSKRKTGKERYLYKTVFQKVHRFFFELHTPSFLSFFLSFLLFSFLLKGGQTKDVPSSVNHPSQRYFILFILGD